MNFISTIIPAARGRHLAWITLAVCVGVAVTVRLGFWQLSRAEQKQARHAAIAAQQAAPELHTAEVLTLSPQALPLHRRVVLQGHWLPEYTVYLDNRPMDGRAGFWVLTPLQLNANVRVLVQRGWVPRHQLDRTLLPPIQTPTGEVEVRGRIAAPPSDLMRLGVENHVESSGPSNIRQNLDFDRYVHETGGDLLATVLQTDPASEGLLRDWPEISSGVEKHLAYAFQWFALAALQLMLYLWFQWIQPYTHARRSTP